MRIWAELMRRLGVISLEERPPSGVEMVTVDSESHLRGEGCKDTEAVPFVAGSAPKGSARCARVGSFMDEGVLWLQRLFN